MRMKLFTIPLLCVLLALPAMPGCASVGQPPAGTYDASTTRQYQADQVIKALDALVLSAKNLNATTGSLHLSDLNTSIILKGADAVGQAASAYASGSSTAATVRVAIETFIGSLNLDIRQHPTLAPLLAALMVALSAVPL